MKSRRMIVASHGTLAEGMVASLKLIVGDCGVEAINCYTSPDFDLDQTVAGLLSSVDYDATEVFVFTDIQGGSVNNGFVKVLDQYDFHLFTNVNLPFLVNFILSELSVEEAREEAGGDTFKVCYCNDICVLSTDLDDI